MGCDGGSIPKRDELVRTKAKTPIQNQALLNLVHWFTCTLSKVPLSSPIVACQLGRLYNRDAVLEMLLERGTSSTNNNNQEEQGDATHIRTMKDVIPLTLEPNPAYSKKSTEALKKLLTNPDQEQVAMFICPVTRKEMNGKHRFVVLESCGCVMAEQALKEVKSTTCLSCGKPFEASNVIVLNPKPEEAEIMATMLKIKQERLAQEKKDKKASKKASKKDKEASTTTTSELPPSPPSSGQESSTDTTTVAGSKRKSERDSSSTTTTATITASSKKLKTEPSHTRTGAGGAFTASVAAKVAEQMAANAALRPKSAAIQSLYSDGTLSSKENFINRSNFNRYA